MVVVTVVVIVLVVVVIVVSVSLSVSHSPPLLTLSDGSPYFGAILVFILCLYPDIFMLIFCINAEPDYDFFISLIFK